MRTTVLEAKSEMPPRLSKHSKSTAIRLVTPEDFLKRVDEWRRGQPDIPNRSEAIRRLVELSLDAAAKKGGRRP